MIDIRSIIQTLSKSSSSAFNLKEFLLLQTVIKNSLDFIDDNIVVAASDPSVFEFSEFLKTLNKEEIEELNKLSENLVMTEEMMKILKKFLKWRN